MSPTMLPSARASTVASRVRRASLAGVALSLVAACGGRGERAADSAAAAGAAAAAPAVAASGAKPDSTCPNLTGRWDECNVRQRLERAGLAPRRAPAAVHQPIFRVPGISYVVGRAELQIFLYPDSAALARDLARVDTVRVQPRDGAPIAWGSTPTLMTSNNLAAVLLSDDATQVERVQLAMTAGLPAPTRKK